MPEKEAPVKAPTRTEPRRFPDPIERPDPDRRLNPDRLCPQQKREVVRRIVGV